METKKLGVVQMSELMENEEFGKLLAESEKLSALLVKIMRARGNTFRAVIVECYALAKAWATVRHDANHHDLNIDFLFESMVPEFTERIEKMA